MIATASPMKKIPAMGNCMEGRDGSWENRVIDGLVRFDETEGFKSLISELFSELKISSRSPRVEHLVLASEVRI